jgi:RNA 2',3'-cyclic 3'-phosphodiesterase
MRTFIAIPLPDECRTMLEQMQQELRACAADVRWVAIPSIHLTLKFLGEVNPEIIPELAGALEHIAQSHDSFALRLSGLGCFPNQKNPRVIWCGIEGGIESLSRLQQHVETACLQFGFARESREFHPHLTLGRVNGKRNLQALLDCIKMSSDLESGFRTNYFTIYKSTLKPQGAVHTAVKTIALGA